ncbi:MAG: glycosyl hydrolase, partial [Verrucomicrobia bacterium]|nr:glycosyl hydrolase [Verrucomicrobiota bacterium]
VFPVTSAAHIWGKPLVFGEGFTCWPLSAWQDDPHSLKAVGDRAFSEGVNAFMLHAGAQNPWPNVKPGMTMGKWGTQFTPGQTWWENAGTEWFAYLTRCQSLLQRGWFVGDLCYLSGRKNQSRPTGYAGDLCGEREFLTCMTVQDGKLLMPDGMSYRVLVLPESRSMTVPVARKLRQLVQDGAVVVGPKPVETPGLEDYPACDAEIKKIGEEVWGDCDGQTVKEHRFGKGKVIWGKQLTDVLKEIQVQPDVQLSETSDIRWIHRRENSADVYFISNQKDQPVAVTASFRVAGRVPELWHADTGLMESAPHWRKNDQRTDVLLDLDPSGSIFVVFRQATDGSGPGLQKPPAPKPEVLEVNGAWELRFPAGCGAPDRIALDQLASWTENENAGVKYFSGTATYVKDIDLPPAFGGSNSTVTLDLGVVKNIAELFVNGERCGGTLWKPPFHADISHALKPGKNRLEIRVTNLWPNRMIGDEHEPDDAEWGEPFVYPYAPGKPVVGRQLARVPQWLVALHVWVVQIFRRRFVAAAVWADRSRAVGKQAVWQTAVLPMKLMKQSRLNHYLVGALLLALLSRSCAAGATNEPLPAAVYKTQPMAVAVWPEGKMPGKGAKESEAERPSKDAFHRITNVSHPTLTLFPAPKKGAPAPAMIVCPGGGYNYVAVDKEGSEIAAWLNTNGISALVLKYRVPNNRAGALGDLQRSLSLARANAKEWNIDPQRLGVIGFSAGGNLSARASTRFDERTYPTVDAADGQSCRPDFAVLVYPAYLDDKNGHVATNLNLQASIPPTLIIHSEDDKTFVPGSKLYHAALDAAKIAHEFKLYPTGGHGYGLHCDRAAKIWPDDAVQWLRQKGIIK